jgi:hypothetical protein
MSLPKRWDSVDPQISCLSPDLLGGGRGIIVRGGKYSDRN